jgi:DNA polymerase elongation subunit (family B)
MNVGLTPNGHLFMNEKAGFLAELMDIMYQSRDMYKKRMKDAKASLQSEIKEDIKKDLENRIARYDNLQLAKKVSLNSAYGAQGNEFFRWFDVRLASAITTAGQLAIRWVADRINIVMNKMLDTKDIDYVVASDTDSIYVSFEKYVEKYTRNNPKTDTEILDHLDAFAERSVIPLIDKCYDELASYTNAYKNRLIMKREAIADVAIWTAKKRYIMSVLDNERIRFSKPEIKIMGSEAVRSSTPQICRKKIKESMNIFLKGTEDDIIRFVKEFRLEFEQMPASVIAFPRGVSEITKWMNSKTDYNSATPINVRASILYNKLVNTNKYTHLENIHEGSKIKYIYLKLPNTIKSDVIGFLDELPKEFELDEYIDYDVQYEKSFLAPLKIVADVMGWKLKKTATLF